jgi:hypothetical protein
VADFAPEALLALMNEFVAPTGFEGRMPLLKEVISAIANARPVPRFLKAQ